MIDLYSLIKVVHIVSSTVLLGTGLGTAFQMWTAHRSGDARAIAVVSRHVVWADFLFTTPAVIAQPLTGFAMVYLAGFDPWSSWLVAAYALFVFTGACWLPVVWLQIQARNLASAAASSAGDLPPRYYFLMRCWFWLGWPAFASVLAIFWLMVEKPAF